MLFKINHQENTNGKPKNLMIFALDDSTKDS